MKMDVQNKRLDPSSENFNNMKTQSSSITHKVEDKGCPLRSLLSRKVFGEEMSNRERETIYKAASDFDTSTSGYEDENLAMRDSFMSYRAFSSSSTPILDEEDVQGNLESRLPFGTMEGFTSDLSPLPSSSEIRFSSSRRKRSSMKSRRFGSRFMKPQTSLESCLMAQLYEEHDLENFDLNPLGKPILRPFLVTDGSKIISTVPHESFSLPVGTETGKSQVLKHGCSQVTETVYGVPRLPNVVPMGLRKKAKTRHREQHFAERIDCGNEDCRDHDNARGTSDRALLFYLGLTMGIVSSFLANKQEVENIQCLLKQSENLVQDLQEELHMKDSLTVKELASEDYESQDVQTDHYVDDIVHSLSLEGKVDEDYCSAKAEEKSLDEIEAELEAELQRLESSMKSSSLEGKLCDIGLDPDSVPLWPDSFATDTTNQLHADRNGSRSSTPRSCHYAVSPIELSLRLHQVIQSRLEERIKELEMALQNSQKKIEHICLSNSKTQASSTHDSPIAGDGQESAGQPITINLSGEALAAYNEAYEEFAKVSESDDEDQKGCMDRQSGLNGSNETVFDQLTEEYLYSPACSSREEVEDRDGDEEEMERLLIRQIVEKAKQGSPAVLKAQRAFLLVNLENTT